MNFVDLQVCPEIYLLLLSKPRIKLTIERHAVVKCGANPLTMAGLSGVGDLILTCTGDLSRCVALWICPNWPGISTS